MDFMSSVLDNEQPDFVVLNGDLVSCEWVASNDANKLIDQIVAPLVDRNLPFGATFGNHDASKTCSTLSMSEHMWWDVKGKNGQKLSFTTQSVVGEVDQVGWSNYFVPVYSSTDGGNLRMLLWFFDSKGGRKYQPTGEDVGVPNWVDGKVSPLYDIQVGINCPGRRLVPQGQQCLPPTIWPRHSKYGFRTHPDLCNKDVPRQWPRAKYQSWY
jgi:hypothetical protein